MEWIEFTYPYLPIFRVCDTTECIVPGMYAMVSLRMPFLSGSQLMLDWCRGNARRCNPHNSLPCGHCAGIDRHAQLRGAGHALRARCEDSRGCS